MGTHTERYQELAEFLRDSHSQWSVPILPEWPSSRSLYSQGWLHAVANLGVEEQRRLGDGQCLPELPSDLRILIQRTQTLTRLPQQNQEWPLDRTDDQGLNAKKQHEIARLLPLLQVKAGHLTQAVDIGGGMGHLARLCVKHFGWTFHSIDRDPRLQDKGRWWLKRSRGLEQDKLRFVQAELSDLPQVEIDSLLVESRGLSLGLHTCGPLALSQFRKSRGAALIVNFGCCYDKSALDAGDDREPELNISLVAKNLPLPWTQAALFLATRSRRGMTGDEFTLLKRVNAYRFTLDLFFRAYEPDRGFVVAGDAPKALYQESFSTYAYDRLDKLGIEARWSPAELQDFFEKNQPEVDLIFAAHLIRDQFARPLEIALLLDRALYMEERGYAVELLTVFDPVLSPRNIALIATAPRTETL